MSLREIIHAFRELFNYFRESINSICYQPSGDCLTATSCVAKNCGDLFGPWPNMSPDSTYANSFINLPLDEGEEGSM